MSRNPFEAYQPPQTVKNEFIARGDGTKLQQWTAKRFPWIHMTSMSDKCNGKYSPLGNGPNVPTIFGEWSAYAMYNKDTLLPLPIITGLDITAVGALGTTRKGVVKFKVYTDEDLNEMQKCYFIPGMDIRVQWGWSESCTGLIPEPWVDGTDRARALCEIRNRAQSNPAYDGFQGVVTNFKYNLEPDNSWECELEIISAAEPFSQSTISDGQCGCSRKVSTTGADGEEKQITKNNGELFSFLLDSFRNHNAMFEWTERISQKTKGDLSSYVWKVQQRSLWGKARTEAGGDNSSWYEGTFFNDYDTREQYISYGTLEAAINALTLPNGENHPYGRVDSSGILLTTPGWDLTIATNPFICVLPGSNFGSTLSEVERGPDNSVMIQQQDGKWVVDLCGIMLNVLFLKLELEKVLDGDKLMITFLRNVLKKVSSTCGDIWALDVISDSESKVNCANPNAGGDGGLLSVIDTNLFKTNTSWPVPSTVTNSSIRSFNLDLKLTDSMKTQALYAGGTQQGGSGNSKSGGDTTGCEGASMKPFYLGGTVKNKAMPNALKNSKKNCTCNDIPSAERAAPPTLGSLAMEVHNFVSDQTCDSLRAKLIEEIQNKAISSEKKMEHCNTSLPFDFGFECDGIGGFSFGQLVTADRIPQNIRDAFDFQITKVEHTVTANDWVTKVSTVAKTK